MRKKINTLLCACVTFLSFQIAIAGEDIPIFQKNTSYEQTCAKAKFENKPVLLLISSKSCASYRNYTNKVLNDSAIIGLYDRNFICYNVDIESREGKKLASQFDAMVLPALIYLSPEKQEIFRSNGTDIPAVAAEEARRVMDMMDTYRIVKDKALKMCNVAHLNKRVQKNVAIAYAKKDAKEGKTDIEKQVFEYALNSEDLKYFIKYYVKNMNKFK